MLNSVFLIVVATVLAIGIGVGLYRVIKYFSKRIGAKTKTQSEIDRMNIKDL